MIKKVLKIQAIGLLLLSINVEANAQVNCESLKGCDKKICNLEKDIVIAKKMENNSRVEGLETSLEKVKKHCTDDNLVKDVEDKIDDKKKDLKEHTEDYEEALKENRPEKIEKYKAKMAEDNQEILQLEDELKALK